MSQTPHADRPWDEFAKGLWRENPVFIAVLGLCPALAVTNSVNNKALADEVFRNNVTQFRAEGAANGAWTLDGSMRLPGANQQCTDWVDQGGAAASPNCIYLIRAEQRYGNGDRVFTMEEQRAASQADYDRRFGLQELTWPGRHVRLGIELNF